MSVTNTEVACPQCGGDTFRLTYASGRAETYGERVSVLSLTCESCDFTAPWTDQVAESFAAGHGWPRRR